MSPQRIQELARQLLRDGHATSETDAVLAAVHVLAHAGREGRPVQSAAAAPRER
jgi:hypothetical protein